MSAYLVRSSHFGRLFMAVFTAFVVAFSAPQAQAQVTEFRQAVAQAAADRGDAPPRPEPETAREQDRALRLPARALRRKPST